MLEMISFITVGVLLWIIAILLYVQVGKELDDE